MDLSFDQLMIDIEENDNCGYFPIQVFETQSKPKTVTLITIPNIPGKDEPYEVVGWCSDNGGMPCEATAVLVGDSGSGQALLIHGGDEGIRLRPTSSNSPWVLGTDDQIGEPYLLLQTSVKLVYS
ncbi:MAG: hypothetical protein O2921_00885 [Chloroflexi bacterium]|nr:hypothetical protein [Chloroflexota bacterium]MDA1281173.1 hypothetical protein [Chloroflexota bacterium]